MTRNRPVTSRSRTASCVMLWRSSGRKSGEAIEIAFFSELTYDEVAGKVESTPRNHQARIRSGLGKLRQDARQDIEGHMNSKSDQHDCENTWTWCSCTPCSLSRRANSRRGSSYLRVCECRQEMETLRPIIGSFVPWPTDVLRPLLLYGDALRSESQRRQEGASAPSSQLLAKTRMGRSGACISVKLLATDTEKNRVSMLVRLAPGTD